MLLGQPSFGANLKFELRLFSHMVATRKKERSRSSSESGTELESNRDNAKSPIHDHNTGKSSKEGAGNSTVLSSREEKAIIRSCQKQAHTDFHWTK